MDLLEEDLKTKHSRYAVKSVDGNDLLSKSTSIPVHPNFTFVKYFD